jgi:hypothetical protein
MVRGVSPDAELQLSEGEVSAPERDRLGFLMTLIRSAHELLESCRNNEEAKKNVLKRLRGTLREAIIVFWEAPKLTKYSPNRTYSVAARKFIKAGRADKRRHLRFDHAIPLRMVVDELLDAHHNPRKIKSILQRVEARLLTVEEDKALNRVHRNTMPDGWDWKTGVTDARYVAARIDFEGVRRVPRR